MKKLKQLWAIFGMIAKFLPRVFKEFRDIKGLIIEIKNEWVIQFPQEGHLPDADDIISPLPLPPNLPRSGKTRNEKVGNNFYQRPEKLIQFPGKELERSDDDVNPYKEVPDGRSYFKKKSGNSK